MLPKNYGCLKSLERIEQKYRRCSSNCFDFWIFSTLVFLRDAPGCRDIKSRPTHSYERNFYVPAALRGSISLNVQSKNPSSLKIGDFITYLRLKCMCGTIFDASVECSLRVFSDNVQIEPKNCKDE